MKIVLDSRSLTLTAAYVVKGFFKHPPDTLEELVQTQGGGSEAGLVEALIDMARYAEEYYEVDCGWSPDSPVNWLYEVAETLGQWLASGKDATWPTVERVREKLDAFTEYPDATLGPTGVCLEVRATRRVDGTIIACGLNGADQISVYVGRPGSFSHIGDFPSIATAKAFVSDRAAEWHVPVVNNIEA